MDSYLFGSGTPKFVVNSVEIPLTYSFIENIELESRVIEHESIINTTRNWIKKNNYDHITVTILKRLHRHELLTLGTFKALYAFNKTEVDALYLSATGDVLTYADGQPAKFWLEITELFPLETPWAYDTMRMVFRSKKPVKLDNLQVFTDQVMPSDSNNLIPTDSDGVAPTD